MSKYSDAFKLKVVESYLSGKRGQRVASREFNVSRSQLRSWVSAYRHHGSPGLASSKSQTHYSADFKLSVMVYRRRHHLSLLEAAKHFNIPSLSTRYVWEQRYNHEGTDAFIDRRESTRMKKSPENPYVTNKPAEEMTPEELIRELQYLRTENAYLKKLDALIQQQQLTQKTKQK